MKNLKLNELNHSELIAISGGSKLKPLKELGQKAWNWITATDAYLSFKEGWNSVECDCQC